MFKIIAFAGLLLTIAPKAISEEIPLALLKPCVDQEINDYARPSIRKIKIDDFHEYQGVHYYQFFVTGINDYSWNFYVSEKAGCTLEASGFTDPDVAMLGLPDPLIEAWSVKQFQRRIREVGKDVVRNDIKNYPGQLLAAELRAARSLGLVD